MADVDGLRAAAISLVLMLHFIWMPVAPVLAVAQFGWVGVDLFFVLSGFLIVGILLDHRRSENYYGVFYLRRFFRIIPLYALMLAPLFLVAGLHLQARLGTHGLGNVTWLTVLSYLFFQQNLLQVFTAPPGYLGPAWSLAIEEQFYLLLPPVVRNLNPRRLWRWLIGGMVAGVVLRWGLLTFKSNPETALGFTGLLLPCRWDGLLAGALAACGLRTPGFVAWSTRRLGMLRWGWFLFLAGMVGSLAMDPTLKEPFTGAIGRSFIALFFACTLLLSRLNEGGLFRRWLSQPWLKPLATISYGTYLVQGPTMAAREALLHRMGAPDVGWVSQWVNLPFLALTLALAALSWHFYESPLIRFGHRYKYSHGAKAEAPAVELAGANGLNG